MSFGVQWHNSLWSLYQVFQVYPLRGLCAPSCGWAVTAAGMLVYWTGPLQQEPFGGALMLFKTTHQVG